MRRTLITCLLCSCAFGWTEQELLLKALENNRDIKVEKAGFLKDSLDFLGVKSDAGLQLQLTGTDLVGWHPGIRTSYAIGGGRDTSFTETEFRANLKALAEQQTKGGGRLSLSLSESRQDGPLFTTIGDASFTQPLLKNAWGFGEVEYRIKQARYTLNKSKEEFRKQLLLILSEVRVAYWDWILALRTLSIRKTELAYVESAMKYERTRFALGESAELDTLSTAFDLIQAQDNLVSAEYTEKNAKRTLALYLGIPSETPVEPPQDSSIALSPIPTSSALYEAARKNDPDINILTLTREFLDLDSRRARNALLPQVDLKAGVSHERNGSVIFDDNRRTQLAPLVTDPYIGIQMTWDLLSRQERLQKKASILSLEAKKIEETAALEQLKSNVADFAEAWLKDSLHLALKAKGAEIAGKKYQYALESYKLGTINLLEMSKAQNDFISASLDRLTAEVALKRLEIAVDKAMGIVLEKFNIKL